MAITRQTSDPEQDFGKELDSIFEVGHEEGALQDADTDDLMEDDEGLEEEVSDEDDSLEVEEEVAPIVKGKNTPEQAKIVALKKQLREAREQLSAASTTQNVVPVTKQKDSLVKKYIDAGFDRDTAENNADRELEIQELRRESARTNFKIDNSYLFEEYPSARKNLDKIIYNMQVTGLSAENICLAMFKDEINEPKARANAAVSGTLERTKSNNSISNATRTTGNGNSPLTESERKSKDKFLRTIGLSAEDVDDQYYSELRKIYPGI
jgi:hypothetical protein